MRTLALLSKNINNFMLLTGCLPTSTILSFKNHSQTWDVPVKPFACLHASVINCNVTITSFDNTTALPYEKLSIHIKSDSDLGIYDIQQIDKDVFVSNTLKSSSIIDQLNILLPPMTDLSLDLGKKSSLDVLSQLECDNITISTEDGSVNLNQVKVGKFIVNSKHGNVNIAKPIHGQVEISTCNEGCIHTNRIQGPNVELYTENGRISSKDLYSDELIVKSDAGDVDIKSTHGHCDIDSEFGNVFVGTVDGDLNVTATEGDVNVYLTKPRWVYLHTNKGKINLFANPAVDAQLHIEAESYDIDESLKPQRELKLDYDYCKKYRGEIGGGEEAQEYGMVYLHAPSGKLQLKNMSWFERIKFINSSQYC